MAWTEWKKFSGGIDNAILHQGNRVNTQNGTSSVTINLSKGTHTLLGVRYSDYIYATVTDELIKGTWSVSPSKTILEWVNKNNNSAGNYAYFALLEFDLSEDTTITYSCKNNSGNTGVYSWVDVYTFE